MGVVEGFRSVRSQKVSRLLRVIKGMVSDSFQVVLGCCQSRSRGSHEVSGRFKRVRRDFSGILPWSRKIVEDLR